jgi:integration host factor subunit beta
MTRSELIKIIAEKHTGFQRKDIDFAVQHIFNEMSQALASGQRIEVRGFGSFSLHTRKARVGRNPKTGDAVELKEKHVPHFKPGKELKEKVNNP